MDSSRRRRHDSHRRPRPPSSAFAGRHAPARRFLPNLLVPIDLRDGEPTGPSLFALCESRRVAHVAGATVYAIVMSDGELDGAVVARLGRAGADKVLLCEGPGLAAPALDATHGPALQAAVERVAPLLVLFPAGGAGLALGPSLAARIGAAFAGAADLEATDAAGPLADGVGRVVLRRWRGGRAAYRRLDPVEIERPVVAILAAGVAAPQVGGEEIDVDVIACAAPRGNTTAELSSEPDDDARIPLARVLVVVDPALGPEAVARIAAAAPAGVAVVDRGRSAAALAASCPEIVIAIGEVEWTAMATPRGRLGAILFGDDALPPRAVDVLWRLPAAAAGGELWSEIGQALSAFASRAGAAS
jgi:electron transfer flavoprotein alpha subunit